MTQGTVIDGILETAIDSQLTGKIRATLSEDAWSADGSKVLLVRGSRLIGDYKSSVSYGESRILII